MMYCMKIKNVLLYIKAPLFPHRCFLGQACSRWIMQSYLRFPSTDENDKAVSCQTSAPRSAVTTLTHDISFNHRVQKDV